MNKHKIAKFKRRLSLLLTIAMLVGTVPATAVTVGAQAEASSAADLIETANGLNVTLPTWNTNPSWEPIVGTIAHNYRYDILKRTLETDGIPRYIRLEADIDVSADDSSHNIVVKGKNVLDLNGHKISIKLGEGSGYNTRQTAFTIASGAEMMIIDSRGGGKIFGDSWICAPEDMKYDRAATDLFYNKGTLIINIPDGEIETGRSKKQWVTAASKNGDRDVSVLACFTGYVRGQSNGSAVIATKNSTTVLVSGRVIGRGFYKYGTSFYSSDDANRPQRCSAVKTDGKFIMYGGEIYGLGGANTLYSTNDTIIYSGYFKTQSIDKMVIQGDPMEGYLGLKCHPNYTEGCGYGSSNVNGNKIADGAEMIMGDQDRTVRPKSETKMTSDAVRIYHGHGTSIINLNLEEKWDVFAEYTPYYSSPAINYIGYKDPPAGYDYNSNSVWKAEAEFTVLDYNGNTIGYSPKDTWYKDENGKIKFVFDIFKAKDKKGKEISWSKMSSYTLRCTVTEKLGDADFQKRSVYQDMEFIFLDNDIRRVAKNIDFDIIPKSGDAGEPTNFIVALKEDYVDQVRESKIANMSVSYSYYEPTTDRDGKINGYVKKTEKYIADNKSIIDNDGTNYFANKNVVVKPKAAGPIEITVKLHTLAGLSVDTKTYKAFAMPALTARYLTSEDYAVPEDGYTMKAQFPTWKASIKSGMDGFDKLSDYSLNPGSVIWQYYDINQGEFVDASAGDTRFVFENNNSIFATNRTGEYRASFEFEGTRYYSPRSIYVIATNYGENRNPSISGPRFTEFGDGAQLKVNLNEDADWSGVSGYTLICRKNPTGAKIKNTSVTNSTGVFNIDTDFFNSAVTKENFVPGEYVFEAKVRHSEGTATSLRYSLHYEKTNSSFVFSVNGTDAERIGSDGKARFVIPSDSDGSFNVEYGLYPFDSTKLEYSVQDYTYQLENLSKDVIVLSEDGAASILAPGDAKIRLNIVRKSDRTVVKSTELTVTIPILGFEVEQPDYNSYLGKKWEDVRAVVKSVWAPGGRKITSDTDKYMTVSPRALTGLSIYDTVKYDDKSDIQWTARANPGYRFVMEVVDSMYTSSGKLLIDCHADVSAIETNAFTDTVKTAKEHGIYGLYSSHGYYSYYIGEENGDPTGAIFYMSSKNAHVKDPSVNYIDVISINTSTPAVGDPRYEGTDSNRYYDEFMTVELGSLSDLLNADGNPIVRAETRVSKLDTVTGSGKPYDNSIDESSIEYASVFNFVDGVAKEPTKKYEAGIYSNWLRLDIRDVDADGKKYCFAPEVKLFVNGHLIEFAYVGYDSPPAICRMDVNYYFDVGDVEQYNSATINAADITPMAGTQPKGLDDVYIENSENLDVTKLMWFVDENGNGKCDSGEEAVIGSDKLTPEGNFISNKVYSVDLEAGIADGAVGRIASPFTLKVKYDDSLTSAGQTKEQTVSSVNPNGVFTFPYNYVTTVDEKVSKPADGKYTKYTSIIHHSLPDEGVQKGYTLDMFVYKNLDGSDVEETDLIIGKQYWYTVRFKAYDQARFVPSLANVTLNGTALASEESANKSWYEATSEYVTIHYLFTAPDPSATGVTVYGSVTSFVSQTDDVTVQLIEKGTSEAAYETVVQGNHIGYSLENVLPGEYTVRITKKNHPQRELALTVAETDGNILLDLKLWPYGDVDNDGNVAAADALTVLQASVGIVTLTEQQLVYGDVDGDGNTSANDALMILQSSVDMIAISDFPAAKA